MSKEKALARSSGLLIDGAQKRLEEMPITIIGCGAIGSWLGVALAKMGCTNIRYYENDIVEAENYSNQIFGEHDIGKHKLDAMKEHMKAYDAFTKNWQYNYKFLTPGMELDTELLVFAVDSIKVRGELFEAFRFSENLKLVLDGRIGRNVAMVFAIDMTQGVECDYYQKREIYPQNEAAQIPCTEKTFIAACQYVSSCMSASLQAYVNGRLSKYPLKTYVDFTYYNSQVTPRNHSLLMRALQ